MLSPQPSNAPVSFGRFLFLPDQSRLLKDGQEVTTLNHRVLALLAVLLEHRGQIVSRKLILKRVWPDEPADNSTLNPRIFDLRQEIGEHWVKTAKGRGYCFVAQAGPQVEPQSVAAPQTVAGTSPDRLKTNLPPLLAPMLGREAALADLGALVDAHRLVTLLGPGGIGKSRVAQALLDGRRGRYHHGVCWVELGALTDAAGLSGILAGALGITVGGGEPVQALCKALASLDVLVALDSAEHLLGALAELLPQLLEAVPGLRLLLTSQAPLLLQTERTMHLDGLAVPPEPTGPAPMRAGEALAFAAVALFVDRAQAVDASFRLDDSDVPVLSALCRTLDGLPLAIELAAARIGTLALPQLLAAMDQRFQLLTTSRNRSAPPRHQTLAATFDWSHSLLPAREQVVFRRLGILAGSAPLELVQQVVADGTQAPQEAASAAMRALDALNALIDASLVAASPALPPQPRRFRLLESTRLYARERLAESGELPLVQRRHTAAMAAYFDACWDQAFSASTGWDALCARVEADFDNAREAWRAARSADDTQAALRIATGLLLLLPESSLAESRQLADNCVSLLRTDGTTPPALALRAWLAVAYARRIGAPQLLRQPADQALLLARALQDPQADRLPLYLALCLVAMAEALESDDIAARAALDEAHAIVDPAWPAQRQVVLAAAEELYARRFSGSAARLRMCRHWLALDKERGHHRSQAAVNVIDCELAADNPEAAVHAGRQALEALVGTRNELGLAFARLHLAAALLALDRPAEALPLCRAGWPQAVQFGLQAVWADILAELAARRQQPEAAARLLGFADARYARHERGHLPSRVHPRQVDAADADAGAPGARRCCAGPAASGRAEPGRRRCAGVGVRRVAVGHGLTAAAVRAAGGRSQPHRQGREPAKAHPPVAHRRPCQVQPGVTRRQRAQRDARLQPRHIHAGAGMGAVAEGQVVVGLARQVQHAGLVEHGGVVVGRADAQGDEVTGRQRDITQGERRVQLAVVQLQRGLEAQQLLHRGGQQGRFGHRAGHQPVPGGALGQQGVHAVADQVGGGLMAGVEQEDAVVQQLGLAELLAALLTLDQPRQHVGLGVSGVGAPVRHQAAQLGTEVGHRGVATRQHDGRWRRFQRRQDGQRPGPQRRPVGGRHVQQVADHLHRDLGREVGDEVGRRLVGQLVEQALHQGLHAGFHARDGTLVQCAHQQPPHAGVQRRVVEHQAGGVVLEQRRARAELGRELLALVRPGLRCAVDGRHIVVPRQQPLARAAAGPYQRVHRAVAAQRGVERVGVVDEGRRRGGQAEALECGRIGGMGLWHGGMLPAGCRW